MCNIQIDNYHSKYISSIIMRMHFSRRKWTKITLKKSGSPGSQWQLHYDNDLTDKQTMQCYVMNTQKFFVYPPCCALNKSGFPLFSLSILRKIVNRHIVSFGLEAWSGVWRRFGGHIFFFIINFVFKQYLASFPLFAYCVEWRAF